MLGGKGKTMSSEKAVSLEEYGLVSIERAAEMIGVTRRTLDKWQAAGKIKFRKKLKLGRGPTCQILLDLIEVRSVTREHGVDVNY